MPTKEFHALLDRCRKIHDSKSHDYASNDNPFSNFDEAAQITNLFQSPVDQVFATLIGIKISRLAQLQNGKSPNNESIEDTFVDLVNYAGLWGAYYINPAAKLSEELSFNDNEMGYGTLRQTGTSPDYTKPELINHDCTESEQIIEKLNAQNQRLERENVNLYNKINGYISKYETKQ